MWDLDGKRFGRLFVLREVERSPRRDRQWYCLCNCGNSTVVRGHNLTKQATQSCGCLLRDVARIRMTKLHGDNPYLAARWVGHWRNCREREDSDKDDKDREALITWNPSRRELRELTRELTASINDPRPWYED